MLLSRLLKFQKNPSASVAEFGPRWGSLQRSPNLLAGVAVQRGEEGLAAPLQVPPSRLGLRASLVPCLKNVCIILLCKRIVRPSLLSAPEQLGNWTDGRIPYHVAEILFYSVSLQRMCVLCVLMWRVFSDDVSAVRQRSRR